MKSKFLETLTIITKLPITEEHTNSQSDDFTLHVFSFAYKILHIIDTKARKMQNMYLELYNPHRNTPQVLESRVMPERKCNQYELGCKCQCLLGLAKRCMG